MVERAGGSAYLSKYVAAYPDIKEEKVLALPGGLSIWKVRGCLIRNHVFIDFTEGGNSAAYAWMPQDPAEIWLDTDVQAKEIPNVMLHELFELNNMLEGIDYDTAHDRANVVEDLARNHNETYALLWGREVARWKRHVANGNTVIK